MNPEEQARQEIDRLLKAAGWVVQDYRNIDRTASLGVAVRDRTGCPDPDYMLYVGGGIAGVVEAKKRGDTLSHVEEQAARYVANLSPTAPKAHEPPPFLYESTGVETFFKDTRDTDARSRRTFAFHKPETMRDWLDEDASTFRNRLKQMPPIAEAGLRPVQVEALGNLERSFADCRERALVQMTMGSGKTVFAISEAYRLLKFAKARRVLFLVDRNNLGRQAHKEFTQFVTPDDGRKFGELYIVQHLTHNNLDPAAAVVITTIQRLYSMLMGQPDYDEELDEVSDFEQNDGVERRVGYSPAIPIEFFDAIFTDECHRSIYKEWRQVLEYFDAFLVGLTATPSKQTIGFFRRNLVMEYGHERAVADGVNVPFEVYRIKTKVTQGGSTIDAGYEVDKRDKQTREIRWELLDEEFAYDGSALDRSVVAEDQIRTIVRAYRDALGTDLFPNRTEVPKTLVFAKDDSHAEDVVRIIREEFGKGDDFAKKITYKVQGEKPEDLIQAFRNSFNPRIAVTVDMVATGTDIKPVEVLLFMRDIRSRIYFEQMKGRGTRTIDPEELKGVTPDATRKDRFIIVDAVGVTESEFVEPTTPIERKRTISFQSLVQMVARGEIDENIVSSLAGRIAVLNNDLDDGTRADLAELAGGKTLSVIANDMFTSLDPDVREQRAREVAGGAEPTDTQRAQVDRQMFEEATLPFNGAEFRNRLIEVKQRNEQTIDIYTLDEVIETGFDPQATERAKQTWETFGRFIEEHKNDIDALEIIYSRPYGDRHLTFEQVRRLADAIQTPPYSLTPAKVWNAYERLEKGRVKDSRPEKTLADLVNLVRVAIGESEDLVPFEADVRAKFDNWLQEQQAHGTQFTPEQLEWLTMIRDHVATSLSVSAEDFDEVPFNQHGGLWAAHKAFGDDFDSLLEELSEVLAG